MNRQALVTLSFIFCLPQFGFASEISMAPLGAHYPIFHVEKNENPQNILVAYTKLNSKCEFIDSANVTSHIDYYWLMDHSRYKPVHSLIKRGIRNRLEESITSSPHSISIHLKDLKELNQDLGDTPITISGHKLSDGNCDATATLRLGDSDQKRSIRLLSIFTDSRKTFWPPFRKVKSVTISGVDEQSQEPVSRQYMAR